MSEEKIACISCAYLEKDGILFYCNKLSHIMGSFTEMKFHGSGCKWHIPKNRILDLGCGKEKYSDRTVGIDIQDFGWNKIHDLNKFPYPFESKSFDVVRAWSILEHLKNPYKALEEMKRIAQKEIWIKVPDPYSPKEFAINFFKIQSKDYGYGWHKFSFTWQNINELCRELGLKIIKERKERRNRIFILKEVKK